MGTVPGSPHFEIRLRAATTPEGRIDLSVECLDVTFGESGQGAVGDGQDEREKAKEIVKLPAKSVSAAGDHDDAVRQWCAGLLKKCGEAVVEANRAQT